MRWKWRTNASIVGLRFQLTKQHNQIYLQILSSSHRKLNYLHRDVVSSLEKSTMDDMEGITPSTSVEVHGSSAFTFIFKARFRALHGLTFMVASVDISSTFCCHFILRLSKFISMNLSWNIWGTFDLSQKLWPKQSCQHLRIACVSHACVMNLMPSHLSLKSPTQSYKQP